MFHRFLPYVLIPLLLIVGCAASRVPFNSIQKLTKSTPGYCTAWATKVRGETFWVSAAHCVTRRVDEDDNPIGIDPDVDYQIGDKRAFFIKLDEDSDLSLFQGPGATGLTVGLGEASLGQRVKEYSFFLATGFYAEGVTGLPFKGHAIFNVAGGTGSSGGPVLTEDNIVVGVMQFVNCRDGLCPAVGGASVRMIREFLELDKE